MSIRLSAISVIRHGKKKCAVRPSQGKKVGEKLKIKMLHGLELWTSIQSGTRLRRSRQTFSGGGGTFPLLIIGICRLMVEPIKLCKRTQFY